MDVITGYFPELSSRQLEQLEMLGTLYREWNEKINVISRKDIDSLYIRHVLHSLAIAKVVQFPDGAEVLDIGTGGGFPGVPLAILFPETKFLLADSIGKKIKVVDGVSRAVGLSNVQTRHVRVEELQGRKFDYVVSRAVAPLGTLWKWAAPLLKKSVGADAGLYCLKGGDLSQEISDSGLRPMIWQLDRIFAEPMFEDKYILFCKSGSAVKR